MIILRKQTKLDKSLSPINVWALALGSIIGWGAFVMPGNLFLETAGPLGTAIGMMIGAAIMIIIALSYGCMVEKYPVAGGEFAYSFKGFGRTHAFICAWFLGLSYLSTSRSTQPPSDLSAATCSPAFSSKATFYTIAGWEVYLGEVLFASLALVIFAITSIRGIKVSGKIQTGMTFALVGSILHLTVVALLNKDASIENLKPLFSPQNTAFGGILAIVAIAPWAYVGFDAIPQAAEEFNFSPRKALKIMIISILLGGLMYVATTTVTAIVYPWEDFIASGPFWATGMAVEQLMGRIGLFILGIALMSAILAGIIGFYMASSRLLLSMARAKALPKWFNTIHPEYKTPSNAIKFILLISLITPWFGRQVLLWVVDMAAIGAAIGYLYTSASAFRMLRQEHGSKLRQFTSLIGVVLSLGFIVLLLVPGMPAYLTLPSRIALLVWIALGVVFYVVSAKTYNKLSDRELSGLIVGEE